MTQTCGNCWWFNADNSTCQYPVPLWLIRYFAMLGMFDGRVPSSHVEPDTDASDCKCWKKRWVKK